MSLRVRLRSSHGGFMAKYVSGTRGGMRALTIFIVGMTLTAYNGEARAAAHHGKPKASKHQMGGAELLRHWSGIAIDASGLDHTPNGTGVPTHTFGEQFGPTRASRAMAIVHIAMFDSIDAVMGGYQSYTGIPAA